MKATLIVVLIFTLIGSLFVGMQDIKGSKANFEPIPSIPPTVVIIDPINSSIQSKNVTIVFNVFCQYSWNGSVRFSYRLDNQPLASIQPTTVSRTAQNNSFITQWKFTLLNLPDGAHSIEVLVKFGKTRSTDYDLTWHFVGVEGTSSPVNFTVDSIPLISILSPENKIYHKGRFFPLNFTVNEPTSWMGYSLDNQANITLNGNTTIEVQAGFHTLTVYANDTAGNMGTSNNVEFTLQPNLPRPTNSPTQQPTLSPSPSAIIDVPSYNSQLPYLVGISLIAIGVIGLLTYFKKRK